MLWGGRYWGGSAHWKVVPGGTPLGTPQKVKNSCFSSKLTILDPPWGPPGGARPPQGGSMGGPGTPRGGLGGPWDPPGEGQKTAKKGKKKCLLIILPFGTKLAIFCPFFARFLPVFCHFFATF